MSKLNSKAKALTLTALVASTAVVAYASQDDIKSDEADVNTAKLVVDKVDKDTVKVSVDNVNNSTKAFQLSLEVEGNATFKKDSINWLTNTQEDANGKTVVDDTITNSVKVSDDKKKIDIFVASDEELKREGSRLEVFNIDLDKDGVFKNSTYKILPSTDGGKVAYKSVDNNNKSLEVANMLQDETVLSFNTAPTIALKDSLEAKTDNNSPVIDVENNIITINESYEFNPKAFIKVADEEDNNINTDSVEVTDVDGKVISEDIYILNSGSHEINYKVTDSEGESATLKVNVNVKPETWTNKPTIDGVPEEDITIETGDVFNPFRPDGQTQITAKDAKQNDLEVKLEGTFDLEKAGTYPLIYKATDRFNNTEEKHLNLVINENSAPVLTGIEDKVINVGTEFAPLDGVEVNDETAKKEDIKVSGKINTNVPGTYKLVYEITDGKKTTRAQRNITVNGGPLIGGDLSYMIVKNGTSLSDSQILENITATDDVDGDVSSTLTVDKGNLDTSKDGSYKIIISAIDSSKLETRVNKDIIVTSKKIVDLPESEDGTSSEKAIKKQVVDESAISEINSKLTDLTKDNEVELAKTTLGNKVIYNLHVTPNKIAFRTNTTEYFVDITVPKDIDANTGGIVLKPYESIKVSSIKVNGNSGEMKVGEERVLTTVIAPENADKKELLWTSTNNDIVKISPSQNTQSATITALKNGTSTIRVMATDGSSVYQELVVQVGEQPKEDTEAPIFDYKGKTDIVLANGMKFETPVVNASDNVDTGIKVNISITDEKGNSIEKIDTNISGKYKIAYTAKDKSNNEAKLVINVTVKEAIPGVIIQPDSGNAVTESKPLKISVLENSESLNSLISKIGDDKFEPKIYGKPTSDSQKKELTYNIRLYKKQSLFARIFKTTKNEEIYYIKLTIKDTIENKKIMEKLEVIDDGTTPPVNPPINPPINPPSVTITDVPSDHWAKTEIDKFINLGYIDGYEDNTFRPENNITRAEFVKLVNRVFKLTSYNSINFKDVSKDDWFYKEVAIGVKNGYIDGYEDNTFKPNEYISREESAKIIATILNLKGDGVLNFKDSNEISSWAVKYVDALTDNNIIDGYEDNTFRPLGKTSRAETVKLLDRSKNK